MEKLSIVTGQITSHLDGYGLHLFHERSRELPFTWIFREGSYGYGDVFAETSDAVDSSRWTRVSESSDAQLRGARTALRERYPWVPNRTVTCSANDSFTLILEGMNFFR